MIPKQVKNISGERFGRLVVTALNGINKRREAVWLCQCDCGEQRLVRGVGLRSGHHRSCGCLHTEYSKSGDARRSHGKSNNAEYRAWTHMMTRCYNPNTADYPNYGGRGITVCYKWKTSFLAFLADMGEKPSPKHSIDRINNDGNYEPANCKWSTAKEQANNRRRPRVRP